MAERSMVFKFQLVNGEELACHGRREVMQQNKSHKRPPFPPYIYIELWVGVFLSVGAWWATIPVRPLLAASFYERQSLECENWVAYLPATSPFLYDSFAQLLFALYGFPKSRWEISSSSTFLPHIQPFVTLAM